MEANKLERRAVIMKIEFTGTLQQFTEALDKQYSGYVLEKDGTNTFAILDGSDIGRWSAILDGGWIQQAKSLNG